MLRWPLHKVHITQYFGENEDIYKQFNMDGHSGIDMRGAKGIPVIAVKSGRVTLHNDGRGGYGKYVRMYHNDGSQTVYAHLSEHKKNDNEFVQTGETIGLVGSTGFSSGNHLHFGYRPPNFNYYNGYFGYIDPFPFMGKIKIKVQYDTSDNPIDATIYASVVSFFDTQNTQIEFVYGGDFHMRLHFKDNFPEGHRNDVRTGGADTPTTVTRDNIWDVTIEISDSGWKFPSGAVSQPDSYEKLMIHEILHIMWFWAGLGDLHASSFNQNTNQAALDALVNEIDDPLNNRVLLVEEEMYILVKHPDKPGEIYAVNSKAKRHISGYSTLKLGAEDPDKLWDINLSLEGSVENLPKATPTQWAMPEAAELHLDPHD